MQPDGTRTNDPATGAPPPQPWKLYRQRCCLRYGWTPEQFDAMPADERDEWVWMDTAWEGRWAALRASTHRLALNADEAARLLEQPDDD